MEEQHNAGKNGIARAWKKAWSSRKFRILTIVAITILAGILGSFPYFFALIEQREGTLLNDRLLQLIPPYDVSVPAFIVMWSMSLLLLMRCVQTPSIFILILCSYILLTFSRMITILLFPLNPPIGLITLKDPLISVFYGGTDKFIKKDLFYSGHTSFQFLMFLCLQKKWDKILAFLSTITIAIFLLVQHVHYTIDVVAAFFFTYLIYRLGKIIAVY